MSALSVARPRRAAPAPERGIKRHLRVVQEPRVRHTLLFAIGYLLVAAGLVFAAVTLNALAAADSVAARTLDGQVVEAERTYARLVAEVASLDDPGRIREVAADQLGMVPAEGVRYLELARNLPADGHVAEAVRIGETTDRVKPVLSADR
ncbi:MAG TPA: hypothetical protein VGA69_11930 [Nitriliruptorales bacterium]